MLEACSLERIDGGPFRVYRTPTGNVYPSVSSVIGHKKSDHLQQWRENVGEEVANKISKESARRGTLIHEKVESFLLTGNFPKFSIFEQTEHEMFKNMVPILEQIDEIIAIEHSMFSDTLKVAGTTDCIARINDRILILDWKTSRSLKTRDMIHGYFMQSAVYGYMAFEQHNLPVFDMRIVMTTESDGVLTFDERVKDWLPEFLKLRRSFKEEFGQ